MIATAVLAAEYAGSLDLTDASRVAFRHTEPVPHEQIGDSNRQGAVIIALDAATSATAALHVHDRHSDYILSLSPTITAGDLELGYVPQVFISGRAAIGWHDRFSSLTLSEGLTFGTLNSANLYQPVAQAPPAMASGQGSTTMMPAGTPPGQPAVTTAPPPQPIHVFSSAANGIASHQFGRRFAATVSGGYIISGGTDSASQSYLPRQFGPLGAVAVSYAASRRDTFTTTATAQETITEGQCPSLPFPPPQSCRSDTPIAQLLESLLHRVSPTTALTVSVGTAVAVAQPPVPQQPISTDPAIQAALAAQGQGEKDLVILPSGLVSVTQRLEKLAEGRVHPRILTVSAQLGPTIDTRTGLFSNRLQGNAVLTDPVGPRSIVTGNFGVARSLDFPGADPYPVTVVTGGVEDHIRVDPRLDVGLGAQYFWQNQSGPGFGTFQSYIVFVSVTAQAPTLRF